MTIHNAILSAFDHSAVAVQDLPGDILCFLGAEEANIRSNKHLGTRPLQVNLGDVQILVDTTLEPGQLLRRVEGVVALIGPDHGVEDVRRDAVLAPLAGDDARQTADGFLFSGIGSEAFHAQHSAHRAKIDDRAALFLQVGEAELHHVPRAVQTRLDGFVQVVGILVDEVHRGRDGRGVVDQHIDSAEHKKLTGMGNEHILAFAEHLRDLEIPVWIRHVVVPGITDRYEELFALGEYLSTLTNLKALDVLPYHDMAKPKYAELGMEYPLGDTPPLTKEEAIKARNTIIDGIKSGLHKQK